MLAVSIWFCNLDFIGCHVFDNWLDIRSGHIYFQGTLSIGARARLVLIAYYLQNYAVLIDFH